MSNEKQLSVEECIAHWTSVCAKDSENCEKYGWNIHDGSNHSRNMISNLEQLKLWSSYTAVQRYDLTDDESEVIDRLRFEKANGGK